MDSLADTRENNVKKTLLELFEQRLYSDIKVNEETKEITGYSDLFEENETIRAYYGIVEKLNVEEMRKYVATMINDDIKHSIVVYEGIPTPIVNNFISNNPALEIIVELFHADDLQFNITRHYLVPKHERLSKKENKLYKEKNSLPILLRSDPVCKFLDFRKGEVIRVYRKDGSLGFRIVR